MSFGTGPGRYFPLEWFQIVILSSLEPLGEVPGIAVLQLTWIPTSDWAQG